MYHILMIAHTKQYIPLAIKEKLTTASYRVTMVSAKKEAITMVKEPIDGILIYADDDVAGKNHSMQLINANVLTLLMELATVYDIPIFVIGHQPELQTIREIIPKRLITYEFLRPIHVNIVPVIERFMRNADMRRVKKTILVVDDSGTMLRIIKAWLGDKYSVCLVNSGVLAIKYLALNIPDLILLDYKMPVCDGKQVLEMIRSVVEFADIPVMFLTSHVDATQVQHLHTEQYLLKTMSPAEIISKIDDFFNKAVLEQ